VGGSGGKSSAQQALRNVMEEYASNTRFILTCNYPYKVIPALHSRCQEFDLTPPYEGCVKRCIDILKAENIKVENDNKKFLVELIKTKYPDLRKIINTIQKNVIDKELKFSEQKEESISKTIAEKLNKKEDVISIRRFVIQNEIQFGNDYHQLLKDLFEYYYSFNIEFNKKRLILLCISNAMYQHQFVMDAEINTFACLLQLSELMEK